MDLTGIGQAWGSWLTSICALEVAMAKVNGYQALATKKELKEVNAGA
jgi:hypothetical protein